MTGAEEFFSGILVYFIHFCFAYEANSISTMFYIDSSKPWVLKNLVCFLCGQCKTKQACTSPLFFCTFLGLLVHGGECFCFLPLPRFPFVDMAWAIWVLTHEWALAVGGMPYHSAALCLWACSTADVWPDSSGHTPTSLFGPSCSFVKLCFFWFCSAVVFSKVNLFGHVVLFQYNRFWCLSLGHLRWFFCVLIIQKRAFFFDYSNACLFFLFLLFAIFICQKSKQETWNVQGVCFDEKNFANLGLKAHALSKFFLC